MSGVVREVASWVETATATAGTVTATRAAAPGGLGHFITSVSGTYGAVEDGKTLILRQGATEIARWYPRLPLVHTFPSPIRIEPGNDAVLELEAAAVGQDGAVVMTGYTL